MKTLVRSGQRLACSLANPLAPAALPFFFALAFLPVILRLLAGIVPSTAPLVMLAPAAAGLWFAGTRRESQVSFTLLGTALTLLLCGINLLLVEGNDCCSMR